MALVTTRPDVIVGTPLCRRTSFVLDKFLSNQQEIQKAYPNCSLVLATDEPDFVAELKEQIDRHRLRGEVINYETVKPDYARSRVWSIAGGREAVRQYALSQEAEYLLYLDSDMVYEPLVISIMKEKIQSVDVVFSGYQLPRWGSWGFGGGCLMINRETLNKITFRCYEFKNGRAIAEDQVLAMDLFGCHARFNQGIFVPIKHYLNRHECYTVEPQPVSWFQTLADRPLIRYMLTRMSILAKYNIALKLHILLHRLHR
jgi:hypothetical protein